MRHSLADRSSFPFLFEIRIFHILTHLNIRKLLPQLNLRSPSLAQPSPRWGQAVMVGRQVPTDRNTTLSRAVAIAFIKEAKASSPTPDYPTYRSPLSGRFAP